MKNIILLMIVTIMVMGLASATDLAYLPPIKQGTCMPLVQYCSNCTYVNITSISYPNGTIATLNYATAKQGIDTYVNNSFCNTQDLGTYIYGTQGDPDGIKASQSVAREVTATGKELTSSKAAIYIVVLIVGILLFFIAVYAGVVIPFKNDSDEMTGYVLAVSNVKYLKVLSWCAAWILMLVVIYFSYLLCYAFLDMAFVASLFYFIFMGMVALTLPLFIVGLYVFIANAIRDHKIADALQSGLRIKDE